MTVRERSDNKSAIGAPCRSSQDGTKEPTWDDCTVRSEEFRWLDAAREQRLKQEFETYANKTDESRADKQDGNAVVPETEKQTPRNEDVEDIKEKERQKEKEKQKEEGTQRREENRERIRKTHLNWRVGVAFSGGGVRSATFNLGVLQALAEHGLLGKVGFMSSVSGGSYINGWLAHWIHREGFEAVNDALADHSQGKTKATGPCGAAGCSGGSNEGQSDARRYVNQHPVAHLRDFSSYLTPSRGFFSADVWSAVAAYVLRLLPNMLFVVLAATAVLLAPRVARDFYRWVTAPVVRQAEQKYEDKQAAALMKGIAALVTPVDHVSDLAPPVDTFAPLASVQVHDWQQFAESLKSYLGKMIDRDAAFEQVRLAALAVDARLCRDVTERGTKSSRKCEKSFLDTDGVLLSQLVLAVHTFEQYRADPSPQDPALHNALSRLGEDAQALLSGPPADHDWLRLAHSLDSFLDHQGSYVGEDRAAKTSYLGLVRKLRLFQKRWNYFKEQTKPEDPVDKEWKNPEEDDARASGRMQNCCEEEPKSDSKTDAQRKFEYGRKLLDDLDKALWKRIAQLRADKTIDPRIADCLRQIAEETSRLNHIEKYTTGIDPYALVDPVSETPESQKLLFCGVLALALFFIAGLASSFSPRSSKESGGAASLRGLFTFLAALVLGPVLVYVGMQWPSLRGVDRKDWMKGLVGFALTCTLLFSWNAGMWGAVFRSLRGTINRNLIVRCIAFPLSAAITGGVLFWGAAWLLHFCFQWLDHAETGLILVTGLAPVLLLIAYVGMASAGMLALPFGLASQEWLNRIWGKTALLTVGWAGLVVVALVWPMGEIFLANYFHGEHLRYAAILGWVLTTVSGVFSAFSPNSSGPPPALQSPIPWKTRFKEGNKSYRLTNLLARIAPFVFVLGLVMGLAIGIDKIESAAWFQRWIQGLPGSKDLTFLAAVLLLATVSGFVLDVNRLSLHNFYRYRLIECYLAASGPPKDREVPSDSKDAGVEPVLFELAKLRPWGGADFHLYAGPYPLINCTLNVTKSGQLSLQARRARNFVFSPLACGYTNYGMPETRRHEDFSIAAMIDTNICASKRSLTLSLDPKAYEAKPDALKRSITLGAAMTISGAAQSPNEGSHTSPPVAALLTLFNVRLGWWLGNPRHDKTRAYENPRSGLGCIWKELTAQATDEEEYVYLSDGGHFENLGLYELVRRRCKLIIVGDADCDPQYGFDDLITAIQLCQADFGVTITIDTDPLQNSGASNWSRTAFTVGTIRYGKGEPVVCDKFNGENYGILIYLKSAVTRTNSISILNYDRDSPAFPHEPTANQWFDQAQFEAYRMLGLETAQSAIDGLLKKKPRCPESQTPTDTPRSRTDRDRNGLSRNAVEQAGKTPEEIETPLWWTRRVVDVEWKVISDAVHDILEGQ